MTKPEKCPECGADMKNRDPEAEGVHHWGVQFKDVETIQNPEAQKRYKILMGVNTDTASKVVQEPAAKTPASEPEEV
jgi:hypothetical protein